MSSGTMATLSQLNSQNCLAVNAAAPIRGDRDVALENRLSGKHWRGQAETRESHGRKLNARVFEEDRATDKREGKSERDPDTTRPVL